MAGVGRRVRGRVRNLLVGLLEEPTSPTVWHVAAPGTEASFVDRNVVVTGAAGLIGTALVDAFAMSGAHVLAIDLPAVGRPERTPLASDRITQREADVRDPARLVDTIEAVDGFDTIDVLVHGAGINDTTAGADLDPDAWRATFDTNVTGPAVASLALEERLTVRPGGNVVMVSSINGSHPSPWPAYAASKAALDKVTIDLAARFAPLGVRVNAVAPARTIDRGDSMMDRRHDAHPLGEVSIPTEAIVHAVLFLADSTRSPMTTGQRLDVDGGFAVGSSAG